MLMAQHNLHLWQMDCTNIFGQDTYGREPHTPSWKEEYYLCKTGKKPGSVQDRAFFISFFKDFKILDLQL